MHKKAEVNKIFVFLFSTLIIGFVSILVVQFTSNFVGTVDKRATIDFTNNLKDAYSKVLSDYNSEESVTLKIPSKVQTVCFVQLKCTELPKVPLTKTEFKNLRQAEQNILLFGRQKLEHSFKLREFKTDENCFCIKDKTQINLIIENRQNEIFIFENN